MPWEVTGGTSSTMRDEVTGESGWRFSFVEGRNIHLPSRYAIIGLIFLVGCPCLGCYEEADNLSSPQPIAPWWSTMWASMVLPEETLGVAIKDCCPKGAGERYGAQVVSS